MFRVIRFQDKTVKPALYSWLINDKGVTKCHWPLNGLSFKLKNLVPPPHELNIEERKDWLLIRCEILNEEFLILDEAKMAAWRMAKEEERMNERHRPKNKDRLESVYCPDEDSMSMVRCDVCKLWAHFECVGVTQDIENVPWSCFRCREKALTKREEEVYRKEKEVERKEKEVERKEKEVEEKENEVARLIDEAKDFIKKEFDDKELSLDQKQRHLELLENEVKEREHALSEREKRIQEQELLLAQNEGRQNTVDEEIGAAVSYNSSNFLEVLPIKEELFEDWDKCLKGKEKEMVDFYLDINLNNEYDFIKECITRTFAEDFIVKITFEPGSSFNKTNILRCLIATIPKKFEKVNYDDKLARSKIVANFKQFRNTNKKRNK